MNKEDDDIVIFACRRGCNKPPISPEDRKKLIEMARVVFKDAFIDDQNEGRPKQRTKP